MKKTIGLVVFLLVFSAMSWAIVNFFGFKALVIMTFSWNILWLLGQKNYTDNRLRAIEILLMEINTTQNGDN